MGDRPCNRPLPPSHCSTPRRWRFYNRPCIQRHLVLTPGTRNTNIENERQNERNQQDKELWGLVPFQLLP